VKRPVIEYACPEWLSSVTVDELRTLEEIKERAIMIISDARDYEFYCSFYELEQVKTHLDAVT